jgi:hypothetical protein
MTYKTLSFIWASWVVFGSPRLLFNFFIRFNYLYHNFFTFCNKINYPEYWGDDESDKKETIENKIEIINKEVKQPPKYEDKYLECIRKLDNEWIFTEEENNELPKLIDTFYSGYIETKTNRIEEITKEIINLEKEISDDASPFNYVENCDEDGDELIYGNTLEERNEERRTKIQELQEELNKLKYEIGAEGVVELKTKSENQSRQYIINKRLDKLANCYVIEKTPIGNVLMIYEKNRESFKYYSDCNIPYRYLEVVARKYVKSYDCRPIFVDMEEELRLFEEKWANEQELKKIKEEEDKKKTEEAVKNQQPNEQKKNVFAKFKSYNKDAGGKISMAAPPKNSIPNKSASANKENEKILLKERANRYTYEGKFANFNFLQKIDRKVFNKKLGLSFTDFKKIKN